MQSLNKLQKKIIKAWAFYDWANSVYALVITTAIFPIFYEKITRTPLSNGTTTDEVFFFGKRFINTALISYVSAAIFLAVSLIIPLLSGIADYWGKRKFFLALFSSMGSVACMLLFFFTPSYLELSLFIYFLAGIGFWTSLVFYNSFLPLIAPYSLHNRISAQGYAYGYIGSSLLLILCLILITIFNMDVRWSFVLTGIWWFGFAQITLWQLPPEPKVASPRTHLGIITAGFRELYTVYQEARKDISLKRFLPAFFAYSTAVQTIMLLAVFFGTKEIQWPDEKTAQTGLIISVLLIQFIAVGGAVISSRLAEKIGNYLTLLIILIIWILICLYAYQIYHPYEFYIAAGAVGMVMGAVQSLSRATYSQMIPTSDTASYFSFYDVTEKLAIVVGTFLFGYIEDLTGSMRNSVIFLTSLFITGALLLLRLPILPRNQRF